MGNLPSLDTPDYVINSGYKYTRLVIEAYKSYWQGCNDGDAKWVDIASPEVSAASDKDVSDAYLTTPPD